MNSQLEHHPFCNHYMRPREGCKMCEGLYTHFPIDESKTLEENGKKILDEFFPDVILKE